VEEPDFLYVIYIAATPEKVWAGLTAPEFTRRFFGFSAESDWKAGSPFRTCRPDGTPDSEGMVLESDFPRRLSFTWKSANIDGTWTAMPEAVATCVLEPRGGVVRLTVTEVHRKPVDPEYLRGGIEGWPLGLSRLKTFFETGRPLPEAAKPS
jgi:uncharacterized protein YndB with AHSA1/START domain